MPSGKRAVTSRLREYLSRRKPGRISEQEWADIQRRFAPASPAYLRRLLREAGVPLAPLVEGIRQENLEQLERTLLAVGKEYATAAAAGDLFRKAEGRRLVIEAKTHARFALGRATAPAAKQLKREMIEWMLVWLQDPASFPVWVKLRKRAAHLDSTPAD